MKKIILTILLVMFLAPLVRGQAGLLVLLLGDKVATENFYFSIKLGANEANLPGIDGTSIRGGFNYGLLANLKLSDKFFLVGEFAPLSPKGAKDIPLYTTGDPNLDALLPNSSNTVMALNYIDISMLGTYHINDRFSVGAGPFLGILTKASNILQAQVFEENDLSYDDNIKSELNSLDFGAIFEISYTLSNARDGKGLVIYARYQWGLTDIIKNNTGDSVTNSTFQIGVSLPFIATEEGK